MLRESVSRATSADPRQEPPRRPRRSVISVRACPPPSRPSSTAGPAQAAMQTRRPGEQAIRRNVLISCGCDRKVAPEPLYSNRRRAHPERLQRNAQERGALPLRQTDPSPQLPNLVHVVAAERCHCGCVSSSDRRHSWPVISGISDVSPRSAKMYAARIAQETRRSRMRGDVAQSRATGHLLRQTFASGLGEGTKLANSLGNGAPGRTRTCDPGLEAR